MAEARQLGVKEKGARIWQKSINLPFIWMIVTVVHIASIPLGFLYGLTGLFVPVGIWRGIMIATAFTNPQNGGGPDALYRLIIIMGGAVIIGLIFGAEYLLRKISPRPILKIIYSLIFLAILTLLVDFVMHGNWYSMELFLNRGKILF